MSYGLPTDTLNALAAAIAERPLDGTPKGAFLDCLDDYLPAEQHWPVIRDLIRRHPGPDGFRLLGAAWYERSSLPGRMRMAGFIRAAVAGIDRSADPRHDLRVLARNATKKMYRGWNVARSLFASQQDRGYVTRVHDAYWVWQDIGDLLCETQPVCEVLLTSWPVLEVTSELKAAVTVRLADGPPRSFLVEETIHVDPAGSLRSRAIAAARMVEKVWPGVKFCMPTVGDPPIRPYIGVGTPIGVGPDGRAVRIDHLGQSIGYVAEVRADGRARVVLNGHNPTFGETVEVQLFRPPLN